MKFDLLTGDSLQSPIVRLFDFTDEEAKSFGESLSRLADGEITLIEVHDLPFVEVEGNVRLLFRIGSRDRGTRFLDSDTIVCELTPDAWADVAGLVEPFESGSHGFQWLYLGTECPSILMSADGRW